MKKCVINLMDGKIVQTRVEAGVELIIIDNDEYGKPGGDPYERISGDRGPDNLAKEIEEVEESIMRKKLVHILSKEEIPVETLAGMTVKELNDTYFKTFKDYFMWDGYRATH